MVVTKRRDRGQFEWTHVKLNGVRHWVHCSSGFTFTPLEFAQFWRDGEVPPQRRTAPPTVIACAADVGLVVLAEREPITK